MMLVCGRKPNRRDLGGIIDHSNKIEIPFLSLKELMPKMKKSALALCLAAASMFSVQAHAAMAWAEISWEQMSVQFDNGVTLQGLSDFTHSSTSSVNGVTNAVNSTDPFETLTTTSFDSGAYGFSFGGPFSSTRAYTDVLYGEATAGDYYAATVKVAGTGWFHVTVPYNLVAIVSDASQSSLAAAMIYAADNQDSNNSFYENNVAFSQGSQNDFKSGVFNLSLYNNGGLHSYTFNAYNYATSSGVAPVPEPETYALLGMGLAAVAIARRRKAA